MANTFIQLNDVPIIMERHLFLNAGETGVLAGADLDPLDDATSGAYAPGQQILQYSAASKWRPRQ